MQHSHTPVIHAIDIIMAASKTVKTKPASTPTAKVFFEKLAVSSTNVDHSKFFKGDGKLNKTMGVRMGTVFKLAKQFAAMPLDQVEKILTNPYFEARMGAVSIMDFQARNKKTSPEHRKKLYTLYMKHHDCINNWDLVDRSAPYVVGGYLSDKDRKPLYKLAKSKNIWERRTAIVATYFFIRQNEIEDTFKIGELLVYDKEDLIQKAVGSWIREAGKRDTLRLLSFLDSYASTMPRITLRYAIEKLDKKRKDFYMKAGVDVLIR